jgi:hypothetical protein
LHYYRNRVAFDDFPACLFVKMTPLPVSPPSFPPQPIRHRSILAWPAWRRVLAVLPAVMLLWLVVAWASAEIAPW